MRVTVNIPGPMWWRAARAAEARGTTIAEVIERAVDVLAGEELANQAKARQRREHVIRLARAGLTDALICERTGEERKYVRMVRADAGIKANRQGRSGTKETA